MTFHHLLPTNWEAKLIQWLEEDCPGLDVAGYVVGDVPRTATLWCKTSNVLLCGQPFVNALFKSLSCTVVWLFHEGEQIQLTQDGRLKVAEVRGPAQAILRGERLALQLLSHASGIATKSAEAVRLTGSSSTRVAGTRKCTPGLRFVEKYALVVGGADPHRYDLSTMVMLKDNHIWSSGSIGAAVRSAKRAGGFSLKVEVETQCLKEGMEAAEAGAEIVMIDNQSPSDTKMIARDLKAAYPNLLVEASGGIKMTTLRQYLDEAVDIVSLGTLTQQPTVVDYSLKIQC